MRRLRRGNRAADSPWRRHEERAAALLAELDAIEPGNGGRCAAWWDHLLGSPDETIGSVLMCLIHRRLTSTPSWVLLNHPVAKLVRARWAVSRSDALLAAQCTLAIPDVAGNERADWALHIVTEMLRRTGGGPQAAPGAGDLIRQLLASLERRRYVDDGNRLQLRQRLLLLLSTPSDRVDTSVIAAVDGWAAAVLPGLAGMDGDPAPVNTLLRHLTSATGGRPSAKWLSAADEMLAAPAALEALRLLVEGLATAPSAQRPGRFGSIPVILDERNAGVARAAAWAAAGVRQDWVIPALHAVAARAMPGSGPAPGFAGDKLANACVLALGRIASPAAVTALQRLANGTRHGGFRRRIDAALADVAGTRGLTAAELAERSLSTGGLSADGTAALAVGGTAARAVVGDSLKVSVEWAHGPDWRPRSLLNWPALVIGDR